MDGYTRMHTIIINWKRGDEVEGKKGGINMRVGRKEQKEECHNYVIISNIIKKIKKKPKEEKRPSHILRQTH